ncbi:hypothetical protein J6590_044208 [Homalodisca vitripennis]|nr:hypothetical protein J6590_044208 [Homalodisca vitripennis]
MSAIHPRNELWAKFTEMFTACGHTLWFTLPANRISQTSVTAPSRVTSHPLETFLKSIKAAGDLRARQPIRERRGVWRRRHLPILTEIADPTFADIGTCVSTLITLYD